MALDKAWKWNITEGGKRKCNTKQLLVIYYIYRKV